MKTLFLLSVIFAGFALSGCVVEERYTRVGYRSGYYGGGDDFYYTGRSPYSRSYGALTIRDGRHYYRSGNRYVVYNRPTYAYRSGPSRRVETRTVVRERDVPQYRGRRDWDDDDDYRRRDYSRRDVRVRY